MDRYPLRRQDYGLTDEHRALQGAFREFFDARCTPDTVRAAEGSGFDKNLWEGLCAMGATAMAVPESCGGDGATMLDLVLVAEEVGRSLAPVPWIEHVCAVRLLARLDALNGPHAQALVDGDRIAGLNPRWPAPTGPALVSTGAIADSLIVCDGEDVVELSFDTHLPKMDNIGRLPMALVDPASADRRTVLATGSRALTLYQLAVDEWRLLTAAALSGLIEAAMTIAAEFAKTRYTLGVPIAALQAVSHPLVNMAITATGGRNLARRAAWFLEHEPDERPELAPAAFVFLAEEAGRCALMAAHIQGGLGVSTEAASAAYLLRARGWPLAGGDPALIAEYVAELTAQREVHAHVAV